MAVVSARSAQQPSMRSATQGGVRHVPAPYLRHPKGSFAVASRMQSTQPLGGVVDVHTTTRKITRTTFPWHKNFAQRLIGVSEWHTNLGVSRRGKIK